MAGSRQQPQAAAETEGERPKETGYIVLATGDAGAIGVLGRTLANGPEQAVRRKAGEVEGTFVAVPERNWTVVDQTAETPPPIIRAKTRKWGEARPGDEPVEVERVPDSRPPEAEAERETLVDPDEPVEATPEALAAAIEDDAA